MKLLGLFVLSVMIAVAKSETTTAAAEGDAATTKAAEPAAVTTAKAAAEPGTTAGPATSSTKAPAKSGANMLNKSVPVAIAAAAVLAMLI